MCHQIARPARKFAKYGHDSAGYAQLTTQQLATAWWYASQQSGCSPAGSEPSRQNKKSGSITPYQGGRAGATQMTVPQTIRRPPVLESGRIPYLLSRPTAREMPVEWDGDRQKLRARARRKMGLWAIVSMCMVATALYGSAVAHRKVKSELYSLVLFSSLVLRLRIRAVCRASRQHVWRVPIAPAMDHEFCGLLL